MAAANHWLTTEQLRLMRARYTLIPERARVDPPQGRSSDPAAPMIDVLHEH